LLIPSYDHEDIYTIYHQLQNHDELF
jgi:hypothetical protein